jgi:MerR family redox-sensitive transcriptional activator SoxR
MRWMTIGEVARKMGLRPSAIRYYEKVGVLPKAVRVSGQRRYDEGVLQRLAIVRFAQRGGFKISEIRRLLEGSDGRPPPERWRAMARAKLKQLGQLVARANTMRKMVLDTLHHQCPHLVERGSALAPDEPLKPSSRRADGDDGS